MQPRSAQMQIFVAEESVNTYVHVDTATKKNN